MKTKELKWFPCYISGTEVLKSESGVCFKQGQRVRCLQTSCFFPGMASSVAPDPGEPVGFQKSVAWTTFFLILMFRSWCRHLWVGMLPFEQSWSFSVLLSLLYLGHRKRGSSPTQHYYNLPPKDKEGESLEFPCPRWSGWLFLYFPAFLLESKPVSFFKQRIRCGPVPVVHVTNMFWAPTMCQALHCCVCACSDVSLLPSWHSGSCRNEGDELTVTMTLQWDKWCDSERQWDQRKESSNAGKASWRRPYDLGEVYRMRMK